MEARRAGQDPRHRNPARWRSPNWRWCGLTASVAATVLLAGCGLFGSETAPVPAAESTPGEATAAQTSDPALAPSPDAPKDPFATGVLASIVDGAPAGSSAQYLAVLASDFGWESEVSQDFALRQAAGAGAFLEGVEPRLLGLFFKQGFSILPSVGEGHEFSRDTIVRGPVANRFFLVRAKAPVRIVFLELADNVVIIYPQHTQQPQVFSRVQSSTVAVRESRSSQYLN